MQQPAYIQKSTHACYTDERTSCKKKQKKIGPQRTRQSGSTVLCFRFGVYRQARASFKLIARAAQKMHDWATPAIVAAVLIVVPVQSHQGLVSVFFKLLGTALYACAGENNDTWFRWALVGSVALYECVQADFIRKLKEDRNRVVASLFVSVAFGSVAAWRTSGTNAFVWTAIASWVLASIPQISNSIETRLKITYETVKQQKQEKEEIANKNDMGFKFMF